MRETTEKGYTLLGAVAICALLVVPVAMAGESETASSSAGGAKLVKKLKKKVASLGARVAALEGKPDQVGQIPASLPPSGPAGGALTGAFPNPEIAPDAVGSTEISNPTRAVSLPLASFVNISDSPPHYLNFTNEVDGDTPNFLLMVVAYVIRFDNDTDGAGGEFADSDDVQSTFTIPPDYDSNGSIVVRAGKGGNTGATERIDCTLSAELVNVSTSRAAVTSAISNSYVVVPPVAPSDLAPSDSAAVACGVEDATNNSHIYNDTVNFEGVEFRYTATQ